MRCVLCLRWHAGASVFVAHTLTRRYITRLNKHTMKENKLEQLQKEVSRYFRLYGEFCKRPNEEVVNDLVSSAFRAN